MSKEIVIVTTKPETNEAEYGVREDGEWIVHGVQFNVDPATLAPEDAATMQAAYAILVAKAQEDAVQRGYVVDEPAPLARAAKSSKRK